MSGIRKIVSNHQAQTVLHQARGMTHSESDQIAYSFGLYLLAHPEACSTEKDYPGWTPPQGSGAHTPDGTSSKDGV